MGKIKFLTLTAAIILFILLGASAAKASENIDSDNDGLSDSLETTIYHTDPNNPDTDGDGYFDGIEIKNGYSPLVAGKKLNEVDSDRDGLNDDWEIKLGTDLLNPDTDGDGYPDGIEVMAGYDPLKPEPVKANKQINVDIKTQKLSYAFAGKTLEEFPISSGVKGWSTPQGNFKVLEKIPVKHYGGQGFDYPNTKWNLHFATAKWRFYIHGAYWHNDFGKPKSHGCINVSYPNMEKLYTWAQVGTPIKITG